MDRMMATETYMRANRILAVIRRCQLRQGLLLLSSRYCPRRSEILIERAGRWHARLIQLMDNESRRAA